MTSTQVILIRIMRPARETVQVARLPKDVRVEISMIAAD